MSDSMIERVAAALKTLPIRDESEPDGELDRLRLREAARSAIAAMREPPAGVALDEARGACLHGNADFDRLWASVIDAALKE